MLLQATGITKSYGIQNVLDGISLQVNEKERVGLVGVNGAGKSTFLQILAGEMSYDSGQIHKSKETTIGYLAQNSGLQSDKTIHEEMMAVFAPLIEAETELRELEVSIADPKLAEDPKRYEELLERYARRSDWFKDHGGYEMNTRIRSVLHGMGFSDFPPDTPISTLSGGQKTRLALARILLQAPDLLMLDEPTNHLDIETLTWLEDYLRSYAGGILVVSHDRYFLDRLVTTIVEIERHQSRRYTGNYSRYVDLKAAEYEARMKQYEKQQDEISRMEDFVQKNIVRASTTKRAQSRRKALEKMDRLDRPMGDLKKASFSFEPDFMSGKEVLQVRNVAVAFNEGSPLFKDASFELRRGETAALIGPNGIGKSTLLQCMTGTREPSAGTVNWGTKVKIAYYDQEQTRLNPQNTVMEELWSEYPMIEEARIRTILGNFLFSGEDVLKKISALSGGEKARVSLSKLMLRGANMLILDEPTNHLDLVSREVLESALIDFEGTLLFISHDRYFLNKMAERVLELHPEGIDQYLGNYDDYVEKKRELEEIAKDAAELATKNVNKDTAVPEKSAVTSFEADKQAKREERNRKRRIAELEENIATLEESIVFIEHEMTKPEVYQDYLALQGYEEDLKNKKSQLADFFSEWEILADE
ncbi:MULTISPECIES: ABC-F family ATP-binding cassette domain-containing protein [Paenibacillus]|uniref:Multidrug ABC transporter ATP-binding protein n=1 Tax=Paenibacillus odorifer TaxID=189426 RepID=A0A1R0WT08_9BACL|nr:MULTISPECIES: ABC-F family ATP-binding cassette domain-containing protein [Paenibacillus]AIQ72666.1 multidrug ABC transporter ATP-binding protein [Paenibacillus odorifer]ETT67899.1 ABC transporter-like protein [Paenibacillus sp. FSL H8-237]MEC0132891.1 ABC-F family ATP-binding cassette domain-containing protein [Paenibacillus odorifer]MEC0225127.1 ABC-F family ATP-binding cassette domain-containing protein [Paenibacillus odorifer]OMD01965.1 multidrug ABC transporter ATP-binding protein [Pae